MTKRTARLHSVPDCLLNGEWYDIGYLSALRLVKSKARADLSFGGWAIQHRFEGKVKTFSLSWLVDERPLLRLVLEKESEKVVA